LIVVVLDCSLVLVPASVAPRASPLLQILAPTATERANAVVDDDDEDDDENDCIPLGYCELQQQISPREENIDSAQMTIQAQMIRSKCRVRGEGPGLRDGGGGGFDIGALSFVTSRRLRDAGFSLTICLIEYEYE